MVARASEAEAVPVIDRVDAPLAPGQADKTAEVKAPLTQRASEFMAAHWPWIGALLLLPVAAWLWAWRTHRSAYDEAGLPRGPRL